VIFRNMTWLLIFCQQIVLKGSRNCRFVVNHNLPSGSRPNLLRKIQQAGARPLHLVRFNAGIGWGAVCRDVAFAGGFRVARRRGLRAVRRIVRTSVRTGFATKSSIASWGGWGRIASIRPQVFPERVSSSDIEWRDAHSKNRDQLRNVICNGGPPFRGLLVKICVTASLIETSAAKRVRFVRLECSALPSAGAWPLHLVRFALGSVGARLAAMAVALLGLRVECRRSLADC
jgi:hypothetical protein